MDIDKKERRKKLLGEYNNWMNRERSELREREVRRYNDMMVYLARQDSTTAFEPTETMSAMQAHEALYDFQENISEKAHWVSWLSNHPEFFDIVNRALVKLIEEEEI